MKRENQNSTNRRLGQLLVIAGACLLGGVEVNAQSRNLTAVVIVNSQNTDGYNVNSASPGKYQRFTERYLEHLQIPYELFDASSASPPADLNSRQLIISGHSRLLLSAAWRTAIVNAVNGGTGFVNLDSDTAIGSESHMNTIFGSTSSALGTPATQISIPAAVAPGGASAHYIAALQKQFDSSGLTYSFHAGPEGGSPQSATSTVLANASGTVIARLGSDALILAKTFGSGRAVSFGTLDYLNADRFGFVMGVDDLFWRSLVWAARKPFVVRGYPRLWSVQMDDTTPGWGTRVADLYDPSLTGPANADGTGGPWKVTGYLYTDNAAAGSVDRGRIITDINAGKLEVTPHSYAGLACGDMYWNGCSDGALTDSQWQANMASIDTWKQGNGGSDRIPSFSRSLVAHYWDLSDNTGFDLWNHFGFRYITSIQKSGFQSVTQNNGAERLPARSFWLYAQPPKTYDPNFPSEEYPFFFADDYTIGSRTGLPSQTFFLFATQYLDFTRYSRPDFEWPNAFAMPLPTPASSTAQLQQYTWRHWAGLGPVQVFTHDSLNYANSSVQDRQTVISQASSWLNTNGVRHIFMDDLGDYIYARTKSKLTNVTFDGSQLSYTFTGKGADADGNLISTQALLFQGDSEGTWQTIPGFANGLVVTRSMPPTALSVSPVNGPTTGGTLVTVTGSGFTADSTVFFGSSGSSSVTFVNSSTLRATTPTSSMAGAVDVRVVNSSGASTLPSAFTYVLPPPTCPCTVWNGATTPTVVDSGDTASVELGVRFRSDVNGFITGLKFYKSASNTGTHIANLWSNTGALLASTTFTAETGSGWQQVNFPSAVAVTMGTTYVASYFAPNGHYSMSQDFFTSAGTDNAPLHLLKDGLDGANGVYSYGASSLFPTSSFRSSNYWVDVVLETTAGSTNPTVGSVNPAAGATNVAATATVNATFSKAMNAATITSSTFQLKDSSNNPVTGTVTYNPANLTATLTPSAALNLSGVYTATVIGGGSGVKDTFGNSLGANFSWSFTIAPPPTCPCSVWNGTATPAVADSGDTASVEVGVRFRSDVNGFITGLKFYKSTANTGAHVANLWSNTGTLLASTPFTAETGSGWQQVNFPSAVAITAGTTYVASYFAPNGHYSMNQDFFTAAGTDNAPMHLLKDGLDGANGVFSYGTSSVFPTDSFRSSNYWVDVILDTAGTVNPAVTSVNPVSGATNVSATTAVSATFSKALNATTVTSSTFQLKDASNNPVPGAVAYNSSTLTATLTPTTALNPGITYTATVVGGASGVTDTSGNPMAANFSWNFTTFAPPTCPCSVWDGTATPAIVDSGDTASVEVGVRFRSDTNGLITGLKFYKSAANVGLHVANLWSNTGTLLASAPFTSETGSGWQQVSFASPVAVTAGTTYVASYFAPSGRYSMNLDYFTAAGVDNVPLHLLKDGMDGANGVYLYSASSAFPTTTYRSSNYWVDVVFATATAPTVSLSSVAVSPASVKGGTSATGTVTLSGPAPASISVPLTSSNPAAVSVPAQVTVPSGAVSATFPISTSAVPSATTVTISGTYQVAKTASLVVNPPIASNLTLNPTAVTAGGTSVGTVTIDSPAPASGAVVSLSSSNTTTATVPASMTIAAGATSGVFTVTSNPTTTTTGVTITASYNGSRTAVLTVNGVTVSSLSFSPTSVPGGTTSVATVRISRAATTGGVTVALSSNSAAGAVPATVTVASGATAATFNVTTSGVSSNTTVRITASFATSSVGANLTVTPPTLSAVNISPLTVSGGASATGTVVLSGVAPTGGAVVTLSDTNAAASVPATVTVPAGTSQATFTITTVPTLFTRTGRVSGTYRGATVQSAVFTVNSLLLGSLTVNPSSVVGGRPSTGTVTLSDRAPVNTTVSLTQIGTSASMPSAVVVPAGSTDASFTINTSPVLFPTGTVIVASLNTSTRIAVLTIRR